MMIIPIAKFSNKTDYMLCQRLKRKKKYIKKYRLFYIICCFMFYLNFILASKCLSLNFLKSTKMYLNEEHFYDAFRADEYNDFKFWREPIMEITLDDLELPEVKMKEITISSEFDSFLYWRDPIPDPDLDGL